MYDRIADPWGPRTPYRGTRGFSQDGSSRDTDWPARLDVFLAPGVAVSDVERWVQSASVLHSNGDAFDFAVCGDSIVGVRGRIDDRVNRGRLGPKDLFGWQAIQSADRLTRPHVRSGDRLVPTSWDQAMDALVERCRELLAEPGGWGRVAFYSSGQLALEDYYTLGVIGKAGIGTPHMDGNTRLCTATAASALKASFGTDGQPGSYSDIDACDALALWGHNVAETQTMLWARMLDRRAGAEPPALLVVDPRPTPPAMQADVHLSPRIGTNVALMNALLRELIERGWYSESYVAEHTLGFEHLRRVVSQYTLERAAEICDVPERDLAAAAELVGTCDRLVSTVLQGFYQSHQATAASCCVNNIHLLRGMIGRPGAGVLQMNGQPTAQNNREAGADGDLPGFRNWENSEHVRELAQLWNVDEAIIPHWSPPTHAMQIFRYAEQGSIKLLWIIATNPAVSLPDLARIRSILANEDLTVVVQDIFMTETAELADIVLPAATWGERTGTFTNADRTVHLSEQAVAPPGEARCDLDILLDFAARMDFRDRDGAPLISWNSPEAAFEAWKRCSRGRPCDYSGITYELLRGPSGVQWPRTDEAAEAPERLYVDGQFNTDPDFCETFGHDLATGAPRSETEYRAIDPDGRAFLYGIEYEEPPEQVDTAYPMLMTTGRTLYQFHTRTKTGRSPQLDRAAPDPWLEISAGDAAVLEIEEGDQVRVESRRGAVEVPARITRIRSGHVFIPFHYGAWISPNQRCDRTRHTSNELTITVWDPVSKQPMFKMAAVRVTKLGGDSGAPSTAPTTTASAPAGTTSVPQTQGGDAALSQSTVASDAQTEGDRA